MPNPAIFAAFNTTRNKRPLDDAGIVVHARRVSGSAMYGGIRRCHVFSPENKVLDERSGLEGIQPCPERVNSP